MKKNFFLTLMLGLLCIATGRAQFAPVAGNMYALQEVTSGLYLDIQTLGINEPNANATTNNISLNFKPCVIYFAAGTTDNKWTMKNVNGTYAMQAGSRDWNAVVGTTAYEWLFAETGTDTDLYTIARSDGKFISMDTPTSGNPLYCDRGTGLKFKLVEYSALRQAAFTLKSPLSGVTKGAIQSAAQLNAITTATKIVIQNVSSNNSLYLAANSNQENIENAVLVWEPVNEGTPGTYYLRTTDAEKGYIQAATGSAQDVTLGAKATAQVFVATAPTTGSFTSESLVNADNNNLVRFQQDGASTWLNCNSSSKTPQICHTGTGGFTVHNVYLVVDATYLNLKTVSTTAASMQATPTEFYIIPSADTYLLQNKADEAQYVGYTAGETWDVTTSVSFWKILDDDNADGYVQIERGNDNDTGKYLGSDEECVVNKGVYTNVSESCNAWCFTGVYENYATTATSNGSKYEFTSGFIYTAGPCNKIRFTLTESGAYYSNGAKRLSFVSFVLYDAKGNVVPLTAGNITGNNGKVYDNMLDDTAGTYTAGTWDNASATDDWFEIDLGKVNLEGAFKFSFVTENTQMNAKAFEIKMSYEKPADYIFGVNAPDGKDYSVTYNGEAIAAGDPIGIVSFDEELLVATEIAGYTWSVVVDDENKTITLVYTAAEIVENPDAVVALLNRIGGDGTDDKFKIVLDPSMNSRQEVFVINGEDGKVLIKGTTLSAITTGIGWYLQNIAHINISWNSLNEKTVSGAAYADLSSITVPTAEETHTSDAMYRYYLNTCAFGYSMTSWTWERWQQEIDWMALHGINMPLQLVGLEEVWRQFLTMEDGSGNRKYGYTDEEAKAFVAGPAFIAWWAMNNLQGWGGTAAGTKSGGTWEGAGGVQDDAWYTRQKNLAGKIVARQRELGMQPVIPGWSGMVPSNFEDESGYATRGNGDNWAGDFVRPLLLSVNNANYAEIAADYYACLHEVMGESRYYSMDPFHEGGGAGTMEDYEALYAAMEAAMPGSKWVIQQWQWSATQKYSLTAVPAGRLVVLDLFSDGSPKFDTYSGYAPQDAVFCAIPNFGGRSGLMGRLTNLTDNYFLYKGKYSSIKGIGAAPEAIEQTPVTYDLIFQLPWMNGVKPDVAEWVNNYSIARYGVENEEIQEAWSLLRQGVLNYGADAIQGPVEDVWAAVPNLTANAASAWGSTISKGHNIPAPGNTYTKERRQMLIDATYKLLSQENAISGDIYLSNYNYDLVELGGGVLADYAHDLLLGINDAKTAAGENFTTDATYIARRDAFLQLILDVDRFKGTNLNFRLGKWTQEARDAAGEVENATTATPDWYEYNNARTIVSTWSSPGTNLNDYSYRSWQGLMKDLYYPRWKYYFDNNCTAGNYNYFAWNWAHGKVHEVGQTAVSDVALTEGQAGHTSSYTREPEGNTVEVATEVLDKYIIPIKADNGAYYAYRYLGTDINNFTAAVITIPQGAAVDLSKYLGDLTSAGSKTVTVAGDAFEDTTNFAAVTVKADAEGNSTVTVTVSDGTALTFTVNAVAADYFAAKEELAALIEDMEELTALVGTFNPVGTVTEVGGLTAEGTAGTTDLYVWTNAQENSEGPIKNLVDGSVDTHFHSEYSTNVGANHFVNVDLGSTNALSSFIFSYATRKAATNFPKTIVVSGCNEREGTYEYIATITDLPVGNASSSITFTSDRISCGKEYAYLRFTVTANNSNNTEAGGHPYFHMAELNLYNASTTATLFPEFEDTELTNDFATVRYDVLLSAINVYENCTTAAEFNEALSNLQTAYDELKEKYDAVVKPEEPVVLGPITITTDEEHPVLYKIIVNRDFNNPAATVLQYNEKEGYVNIAPETDNASYQAWYFMESANGFVIKPYNAMGKVLGADDNSDGGTKVWAVEIDTKNIDEWTLEKNGDWYNILGNGNCFSNHGGGNSGTMGFYNDKCDGGSQFQFVPMTFENDNARYYQLKDVTAAMDITKQAMSGEAPGCREGGDAHFDAYTAAAGYINEGNTADADDCYDAYTTLRATSAALGEMKMPEPGEVYRIKNFIALGITGQKYHYIANNNAAISFPTEADNSTTLWVCVAGENGTYKFVSAMGTATLGWQKAAGKDDIQEFSIETGVERGAVALNNSGVNLSLRNEAHDKGLGFDQASNNVTAQVVDWSTDWLLEPVADANVYYRRTLGNGYQWGTLYLPFAVEVPAGVTAYYATQHNVGNTVINLTEVGSTIPAYTPVLIGRSEEDSKSRTDYDFTLTTADVEAIDGNIFEGSILTSYVECQEYHRYYLLLNASKGEAFYWIKHEYNGNGGSGDTHIKCDANKAYLSVDTSSASPSSYYRFEFEDGSTTGVEELECENGKAETIYDLQGRKLTEITEPGIYIIDGNKVLVK